MVSAGCAAGLKHVAAACVSGGNPEKLLRIPDLAGLDKTECVVPRTSRSVYDHAIRNIGLKMINVDTAEEFQSALSSRTAMIYLNSGGPADSGPLSLENIARMAKPWGIPILVDAAAEVLTIPNVHLARGASVVAYSGGKAICGPQCAGLLLGRKDILQSAWQASSPHHGPGRDNKVGRDHRHGGRRGGLGEAGPQGRMGAVDGLSGHDCQARDAGGGGEDFRSRAAWVEQSHAYFADLLGSGEAACDGRGTG
jgi:selenocysteine lyase/cysteine desulfurase